ncbi:MAG: NYN domain-containing protein [Balneolaceae bacterium]|nr:NYN domain-containing protein [Balneolaceae bacterium]
MDSSEKVGIYVDAANVSKNGGFGLRYEILRTFACRGGKIPARLNVYQAYDAQRAETDATYREKNTRFSEVLRDFGYKVIEKPLTADNPEAEQDLLAKSSVIDVDMTIDIMRQAEMLDRIVLLTGKGAFARLVATVQQNGCRVEVVGFDNISPMLKKEADIYISGYLIPGLLPVESPYEWGNVGSRVRGVCYDFSHNDGYGFMRYLVKINDYLWVTDSRFNHSPYKTVFAHISQFEDNFDTSFLPSRDLIFEFDLTESEKGLVAENIELISAP